MILPISDEPAATARTPWVTLGLIAACIGAFVLSGGAQRLMGQDDQIELVQAVDYWLEHPYLEPRPEIVEAAAFAGGYVDSTAFVAQARKRSALPPLDAEALDQEQLGLDYLTRLSLRGTDLSPGPEHPFRRFGLVARAPRVHAFLTHVFLHAGWLHLGLALALIGWVGPVLESRLGRPIVAGVCLLGALVAGVTHLATGSDSPGPLIGATGVAAALLGAFAMRFGSGRVRVRYVTLRRLRPTTIAVDVAAWALLPAGIAVQIALCLLFAGSNVLAGNAWPGNLAAFSCGAVLVFTLQRLKIEERFVKPALEASTRTKLDPRIKRALTARERGQHADAIALADAVLRERPEDIDGLQTSWDAHVAAGRAGDGARSARRLVELHARRGDLASAARLWDELLRVAHRGRVEPTTLLRIIPELVVQARRDAAIAALRAVIDPANASLTVGQALRVAELGTELDPPTALHAARFALERGELVDERRARLEQLVLSLENSGVRVKSQPTPAAPELLGEAPIASTEEPDVGRDFELATNADSELLGLADEASESAVEPPPPPSELFELEPTQLGVEPQASPPAPSAAPPLVPPVRVPTPAPAAAAELPPAFLGANPADDAFATVLYTAPAAVAQSSATLKITPAIPVALDVHGLRVRLEGGAPSLIEWTRIQAIGVGLVSGLGANPVVVIDLALNWADAPDGALEVMRLRSDGFRARQLVTGASTALEALRALLADLLARSGAVPLPDPAGARGTPFREYATTEAYHAQVLLSSH